MLEKQEKDVSVLFADLSGYSRFSRMMDHDRVNAIVELYFSSFLDCIHEHGGDITATAGDGMMIVFQTDDILEHSKNAARAALKILGATDELNRHPHEMSGPIAVHMGLNSGVAMVGSARFEGLRGTLWTFTANGPVTNLAARLGAAPDLGAILVGPETAGRIGGDFVVEHLGPQEFKNLEPVEVYRLIGERRGESS